MPGEPFAIYVVPDDAPATIELMGTKPKFWFSRDGDMWLFKATRFTANIRNPNTRRLRRPGRRGSADGAGSVALI